MRMSEEEDYDELPPITVNSSTRDSSSFAMPSANELATQRAREEECEQQILKLREEHQVVTESIVASVTHSDSSGSEGEVALAAAVGALRVRAGAGAAPDRAHSLAGLLTPIAAKLAAHADTSFLTDYLDMARDADVNTVNAVTDDIVQSVSSMVCAAARSEEAWQAGEALCAGAWLCCALAARGGGTSARRCAATARAAHLLLDDVATGPQITLLKEALVECLPDNSVRLELSDALRSGGAHAESVANALVHSALCGLLGTDAQFPERDTAPAPAPVAGAVSRWRRLSAREQYLALQLLGRALAHGEGGAAGVAGAGGAARRLLDALCASAPNARDHQPDTLKVLVAASKLQVLFHAKK